MLGEVRGWGTVEVGDKGWRAAHQQLEAIYATHPDAGRLAAIYDVPLVTL